MIPRRTAHDRRDAKCRIMVDPPEHDTKRKRQICSRSRGNLTRSEFMICPERRQTQANYVAAETGSPPEEHRHTATARPVGSRNQHGVTHASRYVHASAAREE